MSIQIIVGYTTEGTTDVRFLDSIIQRTFERVAFECRGQVEVLPIQYLQKQKNEFIALVVDTARQAEDRGLMILCVHTDADDLSDTHTFQYKIDPAFSAVYNIEDLPVCKTLVPIVPIKMTEAWMLSDKDLLKSEIGTSKSDVELGIDKLPENYTNPKQSIESAIRIARQDLTKRRRHDLNISDLYSPIGQKLSLEKLDSLTSYRKFKESVRDAFKCLQYLQC